MNDKDHMSRFSCSYHQVSLSLSLSHTHTHTHTHRVSLYVCVCIYMHRHTHMFSLVYMLPILFLYNFSLFEIDSHAPNLYPSIFSFISCSQIFSLSFALLFYNIISLSSFVIVWILIFLHAAYTFAWQVVINLN